MYKVIDNIDVEKLGKQYIVKNENSNNIHIFNQLAGEILLFLKDNEKLDSIIDKICSEYVDLERSVITQDVKEIVEEMIRLEIIQE